MGLNVGSKQCIYRFSIRKPALFQRWYDDCETFYVVVTRERSAFMVWDTSLEWDGKAGTANDLCGVMRVFQYSRDEAIEWAVDYGRQRQAYWQGIWGQQKKAHEADLKAEQERTQEEPVL